MSVLAEQSSFSFRPDPAPAVIPVQPVKRGCGRPPGSKNKPKTAENSSRPSCPWPRGRGRGSRGRGKEKQKKTSEGRGRGRGRRHGSTSGWIEESSVSVMSVSEEEVERWVIIGILLRAFVYIWFWEDQEDLHHELHHQYLVPVQDVLIELCAANISVQWCEKTLELNQTCIVLSAGATVTQMF